MRERAHVEFGKVGFTLLRRPQQKNGPASSKKRGDVTGSNLRVVRRDNDDSGFRKLPNATAFSEFAVF